MYTGQKFLKRVSNTNEKAQQARGTKHQWINLLCQWKNQWINEIIGKRVEEIEFHRYLQKKIYRSHKVNEYKCDILDIFFLTRKGILSWYQRFIVYNIYNPPLLKNHPILTLTHKQIEYTNWNEL